MWSLVTLLLPWRLVWRTLWGRGLWSCSMWAPDTDQSACGEWSLVWNLVPLYELFSVMTAIGTSLQRSFSTRRWPIWIRLTTLILMWWLLRILPSFLFPSISHDSWVLKLFDMIPVLSRILREQHFIKFFVIPYRYFAKWLSSTVWESKCSVPKGS